MLCREAALYFYRLARQHEDLCGEALVVQAQAQGVPLTIDLPAQEIRGPDGGVVKFEIDPFRKRCLVEGLDDIGLTLQKAPAIDQYETTKGAEQPWL